MAWWQYLMLVNIYLLLFYGFYALLLRLETFFQLNRIYLVSAALLSFFIPMIQADWVKNLFITQKVEITLYSSPVLIYGFNAAPASHYTVGQILTTVYLLGIGLLVARFVWQLLALKQVMKKPEPAAAFSFFKKIKLTNNNEHQAVIAAHENVHASQWHSADILIMEVLTIVNWFNPIVYLYRFAIKHIHEFIADKQAIKSGTDKADYALILLSQTFNAPTHRLVNPFFNKSLLKQRIIMLQKNKSQRVALIKYFLSAPLFILMLILSSATVNDSKTLLIINSKVERVFQTPASGAGASALTLNSRNDGDKKVSKPATISLVPAVIRIDTPVVRKTKDNIVFTEVEQVPEFPGGVTAFSKFLAENIKYPQAARDKNTQGRVIIRFIVETDGSLSNFRVLRGIGDGADEEAVRVLALSPKWTPGVQNGHKVRVAYSVPISFTLSTDDDGKGDDKGMAPQPGKGNNVIMLSPVYGADSATRAKNAGAAISLFPQDPSSSPLYIVDGVQVTDLSNVQPKDIESISVVKDKTKIGLYGDKGRNGVVFITTKGSRLKLIPVAPAKN